MLHRSGESVIDWRRAKRAPRAMSETDALFSRGLNGMIRAGILAARNMRSQWQRVHVHGSGRKNKGGNLTALNPATLCKWRLNRKELIVHFLWHLEDYDTC